MPTAYVEGHAVIEDGGGNVLAEEEGMLDSLEAEVDIHEMVSHGVDEVVVKVDLEAVEIER